MGLFSFLDKKSTTTSSTTNNTQYNDSRIANESGLVATGGSSLVNDNSLTLTNNSSDTRNTSGSYNTTNTDNSTVNVTDGGIVKDVIGSQTATYKTLVTGTESIFNTLTKAVTDNNAISASNFSNTLKTADAQLSKGYGALDDLVGLADSFSKRASDVATSQAQGFTQAIGQAYDNAKASATGALDNKTIMLLGMAALGAAAFIWGRK